MYLQQAVAFLWLDSIIKDSAYILGFITFHSLLASY